MQVDAVRLMEKKKKGSVMPNTCFWLKGGGKGKWGFIDKTGKVVIPLKYDGVGDFNEGKVDVLLDGKKMWLDKNRKTNQMRII